MEPTLREGERLLVLKKNYSSSHLPSRGEIIIFPDPQEGGIVVKRVIALPGEHLTMFGTQVFINGKLLSEPYARGRQPTYLMGTLPKGKMWVLGDNRDNSADSRVYGPIELGSVRGRAVLVMWPPPPRPVPHPKPERR